MARRGACHDDEFTNLLHLPLQSWGIGRRASRLAPFEEFRSRLRWLEQRSFAGDSLRN